MNAIQLLLLRAMLEHFLSQHDSKTDATAYLVNELVAIIDLQLKG